VRALDTNVIVRLLVADDAGQAGRVRQVLEAAEASGDSYQVPDLVVLELLWGLSSVYEFTREEALRAIQLLVELPVLEFEDHDRMRQLIDAGRKTDADLPDLFIGLAARARGCECTLTFDRRLHGIELFRAP